MYFKTKNGITIIALIITVVIMIILAGVSINYGINMVKSAKIEDIKTNMLSIKARAKIVLEEHTFDNASLVGTTISSQVANTIGEEGNNNKIYVWSSQDLDDQGLSSIEGGKYAVYYENNCEVYYLDGYDGKYSLSELQDM